MSATAIEAFLKAAKGDLTLKTKLGEADGAAAVVELAKEAGFDFSVSALKRYQHTYVSKLSDEELVEGSWNTRACCATWETPWQYDMLVAGLGLVIALVHGFKRAEYGPGCLIVSRRGQSPVGIVKLAAGWIAGAVRTRYEAAMTTSTKTPYVGHRFPPELISYTVWLYFRFPLGSSRSSGHLSKLSMVRAEVSARAGRSHLRPDHTELAGVTP